MLNGTFRTKYVILTPSACMPNSCWGRYKHVAIVGYIGDKVPTVVRDTSTQFIVESWKCLNVGKTDKCAFNRALKEAKEKLKELAL